MITPDVDSGMLYRALAVSDQMRAELTIGSHGALAYVIMRARAAAKEALSALIDVDPADEAENRRLRNEIRRYQDLLGWINDAAAEAKASMNELSSDEASELAWMMRNQNGMENDF